MTTEKDDAILEEAWNDAQVRQAGPSMISWEILSDANKSLLRKFFDNLRSEWEREVFYAEDGE